MSSCFSKGLFDIENLIFTTYHFFDGVLKKCGIVGKALHTSHMIFSLETKLRGQ